MRNGKPATHDAPLWILLRGLIRERRHWGDFPRRLAGRLDARIRCLDLPGNGDLWRDSSPLQLRETVAHLREALDTATPVYLLGLSMGGMVATEWALRHPSEVRGLVLINSSFARTSPPWQRMRPAALPRLMRAWFADTVRREALIYRLTCNRYDDAARILPQWQHYAGESPVSRCNFLRQLLAAARYRPERPPGAPILILASKEDRLVNPACSRAIADHWQAEFQLHSSAGHDLPHDDPDWALEQIAQWQIRSCLSTPEAPDTAR